MLEKELVMVICHEITISPDPPTVVSWVRIKFSVHTLQPLKRSCMTYCTACLIFNQIVADGSVLFFNGMTVSQTQWRSQPKSLY